MSTDIKKAVERPDTEAAASIIEESSNASYIVLGGDRVSTPASGYAGKGHSGCHMIDLVVGRDPTMSGHPSFKGDAARIYISQRTDVDHSFGLASGNVLSPKTRSAIGLKADGRRIVAREGIKIVTMGKGTKNSMGKKIQTYTGIDLIAGNDEKGLEPIAKAVKVADAFEKVIDAIEGLSAMVESFIDIQAKYNQAMSFHMHPTAAPGPPSPPITQHGSATVTYGLFGARIMSPPIFGAIKITTLNPTNRGLDRKPLQFQ